MNALRISDLTVRRQGRDRAAVAVGLLAPIVLTLLAVASIGRLTNSFHARFLIVDQGSGVVGDLLARGVQADPRTRRTIDVSQRTPLPAATRAVAHDKATAVFVIPPDFTRSVASNRPTPIRVVLNPADPVGSAFARAVAEQFTSRVSAAQLSAAVAASTRASHPPDAASPSASLRPADLALLASRRPPPLDVQDKVLSGRAHRSLAGYFAPSMAVVGLLVVVQMASRSLMDEHRNGTFRRMLALGVSPRSILMGKGLAGVWSGMATMVITLVVVALLTGARWGSPLLTGALCLATVLAFLSLSTLITAVSRTEELASALGVLAGTFLALVGGNFLPLSQAPGVLVKMSVVTPNGWALRGFSVLQSGHAGLVDLLPAFASLAAFTLAFGVPALWLVRWRLR